MGTLVLTSILFEVMVTSSSLTYLFNNFIYVLIFLVHSIYILYSFYFRFQRKKIESWFQTYSICVLGVSWESPPSSQVLLTASKKSLFDRQDSEIELNRKRVGVSVLSNVLNYTLAQRSANLVNLFRHSTFVVNKPLKILQQNSAVPFIGIYPCEGNNNIPHNKSVLKPISSIYFSMLCLK